MINTITSLDWSLVQTFLAVAESGSLSQASRELGVTQPTVGRQIRQIEGVLDVSLFTRQARGLTLTEAGEALIPHARATREAMSAFQMAAAGRSDKLSGSVRITASVFTAHHILPPILAQLRREEPEVQIELAATDGSDNLLFREADIAVRMYRTEQLDIITQHVGELELGIYGASTFLDEHGRPETLDELFEYDLVGYDRSDLLLRGLRQANFPAQRDWFATRCDHHAVYWELVRAGCGIGFAQRRVAERDPMVERVCHDVPLPTLPLWLAAHETMRQTPRVRRVWDMLYEGLKPMVS
ncbi:LysR family transcriptional regulator [Pseudoprimorskyibacter insulae]|uniref:HTH-type transcriptional activator CmpR n=1 Tax=Pseudoprimorskyibacter insulae TaxID=1695997 RepID=A0A2R8AYN2_9RHOB|nr:LysR family transcriptional regulator [Pseudoprimorskyibacter insulae]SPF81120.1 HTH-type transcriptional activator CmpR [Pseudoprimorskyibacter insulae]